MNTINDSDRSGWTEIRLKEAICTCNLFERARGLRDSQKVTVKNRMIPLRHCGLLSLRHSLYNNNNNNNNNNNTLFSQSKLELRKVIFI